MESGSMDFQSPFMRLDSWLGSRLSRVMKLCFRVEIP